MLSYFNPLPSLPRYRGSHQVGSSEFEIPISELSSTSQILDDRIKTIKFRLYYPTTPEATSKQPVYWLPTPQKEWNDAYASFMGASSRYSWMLSRSLNMWNFAQLPVIKDAPIETRSGADYPVLFFSHGLGGNYNTYSSVVGNLASCGIVCVVPEHRDGSAPVSFVRNSKGDIESSIPYQKLSHSPSIPVLNARNAQLRTRLQELDLTYAAIKAMNEDKSFTNYADLGNQGNINLHNQLNLRKGEITWVGHSFGAATMTQFVKSIFYHEHLPEPVESCSVNDGEEQWDYTPLYKCDPEGDLVKQVTPSSPVILLDVWTMPLRSETTKWLWERPMPCYTRSSPSESNPNMVAVMSAEFYKWTELLNRTRALLSESPIRAQEAFENKRAETESQAPEIAGDSTEPVNPIPELSKQSEDFVDDSSPSSSADSSRDVSPSRSDSLSGANSHASSQTSLVPSVHDLSKPSNEPHLYLVPQSAHLSQSDFGVLFPNLTKYAMKAIEPEKTIELNVRAVLAVMRGAGLPLAQFIDGEDSILDASQTTHKEDRWVRVPLVDV